MARRNARGTRAQVKIVNHQLSPEDTGGIEVLPLSRWGKVKSIWRPTITPTIIVIHYAVTSSLDALVRSQLATHYFAHLSIDGFKKGERSVMQVVQQLPFNKRGAHAGVSSWRGRERCNDFSIGIEIANPGPLIMGDDGKLRTVYEQVWGPQDAVETGPVEGYPKQWTWWARYSTEEMAILASVCRALRVECPTITEIVGHSDVSPGRKSDPGPAFPMSWLRQAVFDGAQDALGES
jgi:N-acetylmuramoyl-L-alanine amidase